MFGFNPMSRFSQMAAYPGVIDEAGVLGSAYGGGQGSPAGVVPTGVPSGDSFGAGPSTLRVTDPSRYGQFGGGGQSPFAPGPSPLAQRPSPAPSPSGIAAAASPDPRAAGNSGMFAAQPHKQSFLQRIAPYAAMALVAATSRGNPLAATEMQAMYEGMAARRKKNDTDADTLKYVNALVAQGLTPDQATIMAADPAEMAKHFGTHYDQKVLNQGDTLATPNLNGTLATYTAPDVQRNGADVVQTPGLQGLTPAFSSLTPGSPPVQLGSPLNIQGLRTDAEQYAAATGARPGTPDYLNALQDYTLKGTGPTGFGHNQTLQGQRLTSAANIARGHDLTSSANNVRSTSTSAANNVRSTSTSAGNNQRSTSQSNINNIRSTQTSAANNAANNQMHYQTARHVRALPNEPTAVDAQGRKIVVRNGQWVPAQ